MKNKIIILILILNLIFICTGCKKNNEPQMPAFTPETAPDVIRYSPPEIYTISPADAVNKIDLFCENNRCENDKWFWGTMPVQGSDFEAGQIFKQIELDERKSCEQEVISEQEMNDGYINGKKEEEVRLFGAFDKDISMIKYDLDGDGEAEIIGQCSSSNYGGTAGRMLFILKKSGDKYINLSRFNIHPYKFQVLKKNPDKKYSCLRFQNIENHDEDMFFCYQERFKSYQLYIQEGNALKEKYHEK